MAKDTTGTRGRIVIATITVIAGLMIAGAIYLSLVPIDISSSHERIEALILKHSTHRVTIERAVLRLLPSPRVTFRGFRIIDGTDTLIYAKSWDVTFTWNSLFSSVLTIKQLEVDSPELLVNRHSEGAFNVVEYARTHRPRRVIRLKSLRVSGARAHFTDEHLPTPRDYELSGVSISLDETFSGYSFQVQSRLMPDTLASVKGRWNPGRRHVEGKGYINGLDLSLLGPYLESAGIKTGLDGAVDLTGSVEYGTDLFAVGTLAYSGLKISDERYLADTLSSPTGGAVFSISRGPSKTELRLDDINISADRFTVNGAASLTGPDEGRVVEVNLSSSTIPVESIQRVAAIKALPENLLRSIARFSPLEGDAKGGARGGVAVENLSVKAPVEKLKTTNPLKLPGALKASVRFDDLSFRHAARRGAFTGFKGGASLEDDTVTFRHVTGAHNRSNLRDISGTVTNITGSPSYDLYLDGQFDAGELLETVRPLMPDKPAPEGALPLEASGKVDVTVRAKGTVKAGYPEDISATARLKDAMLSHPSLPFRLDGLSGHASFNNTDISLTRLSATDGHSSLTVDGRIKNYPSLLKSLKGGKPKKGVQAAAPPGGAVSLDITAAGEVELITLKKLLSEKTLEGLYFDGPLGVGAQVSGPPGELSVRAIVDVTPAQLSYRNWIRKGKNFPTKIDADMLIRPGSVKVKGASAGFGESTFSLSGDFRRDLSSYSFTMATKEVRLTDIDNLSPLLRGDFDSKGIVALSIKGVREGGKRPRYEGGITLKEGRFDTPLIARPVERIDAEALLKDNEAMIIVSSTIGGSSLNARVEVTDISRRVVTFELTSPRLNTADLIPKGLGDALSGAKKTAGPKSPKVTGSGVLMITSGNWWGHRVENFYTEITLGERTIDVHPINVRLDSGTVLAELIYNRDPATPVLYRLTSEIDGVDLLTFIESAGAKKKVLDAGLNGTASLWGSRGVPLRAGLNGNVNLQVEQGTMWKFILFSKIFSIVNIFSIDEFLQTGLRFKSIKGDYSITDGVISTENMVLDSDSMKLSAVGKIDMKDATLDSVLAMHPFVTIDKIITSIPIAGWVITGKEGTTVSMYYLIKGPLKNPVIDPVPKTKIANKVLGIFERILELPVQVLAPGELNKEKK